MSLPRADLLISDSRVISAAKRYGADYGIGQDFFIAALNMAIIESQKYVVAEQATIFAAYKTIAITAGQEYVELPDDMFAANLIYQVCFSASGRFDDTDGFDLDLANERNNYGSGEPEEYFIDEGKIYFDFTPSVGYVRIRYEKVLSQVGLRRGKISAVSTFGHTAGLYTAELTLGDEDGFDADDWAELPEYLCIVTNLGVINVKNTRVTEYDSGTQTVTVEFEDELINSAFSDQDSLTAPELVNLYIVFGFNTTTHTTLDTMFFSYLISFMKNEVYELRSSTDQDETNPKLSVMLSKIAEIYSQLPGNKIRISEKRGDY